MPKGRKRIDLTGVVFGRLVAVEPLPDGRWRCRCSCGNLSEQHTDDLRRGKVRSCGCLKRELLVHRMTTHGLSKTPEYRVWAGAVRRCENPSDPCYRWIGAKGIRVCKRWRGSFAAFLEDMGERPGPGYQIVRLDSGLGFRPGNCVWAIPAAARPRQTRRTHCSHGHPLTDENVYLSPARHRRCRICRKARREARIAAGLELRRKRALAREASLHLS